MGAIVKAEIKQNIIVKTTTAIGIAPGGITGQILKKLTDEDYSTEWVNEGSGGEANTMSSEGTGASIVLTKSGVNLPVKGFKAGANITINETADSLEFVATDTTVDTTAIHKAIAGEIAAITEKGTPIDADVILIEDSADSNNKKRIQIGSLPIPTVDSTKIQDTAGTTSVDTEDATYPNQIIGKIPTATTAYMMQLFSGANPNFQVDGNGNIFNNSNFVIAFKNTSSLFIGNNNNISGTGANNYISGYNTAAHLTIAKENTIIGSEAAHPLTSGYSNVVIGYFSGASALLTGIYNTFIGANSGQLCGGNNNIFIGYSAGRWASGASNKLLIGNQNFGGAAAELTNSIIYGVMAAAPENQDLTFNANVFLSQVKSGATQVGAGAAANEIWKTASHATLPDNVLMIGI